MSGDRLTALQWRILEILSALQPPWTLTGGAALAGFHLKHRTTKDLDLTANDPGSGRRSGRSGGGGLGRIQERLIRDLLEAGAPE